MVKHTVFAMLISISARMAYGQGNDPYDDCDQHTFPQITVQGCSYLIDNASTLRMDRYDLATTFIDRGRAFGALGEYRLAADDYTAAIQVEPSNGELFFHRGNMLKADQRYDAALRDYMRANELGYREAQLFMNVGNTFSALGDFEEATRLLSIAIEVDPRSFTAFYNRGLVHAKAGNQRAAQQDFDASLAFAPRSAEGLLISGMVHRSKRDFEDALEAWVSAIAIGGPPVAVDMQLRAAQAGYFSGSIDGRMSPTFTGALRQCVRDPDC